MLNSNTKRNSIEQYRKTIKEVVTKLQQEDNSVKIKTPNFEESILNSLCYYEDKKIKETLLSFIGFDVLYIFSRLIKNHPLMNGNKRLGINFLANYYDLSDVFIAEIIKEVNEVAKGKVENIFWNEFWRDLVINAELKGKENKKTPNEYLEILNTLLQQM